MINGLSYNGNSLVRYVIDDDPMSEVYLDLAMKREREGASADVVEQLLNAAVREEAQESK